MQNDEMILILIKNGFNHFFAKFFVIEQKYKFFVQNIWSIWYKIYFIITKRN